MKNNKLHFLNQVLSVLQIYILQYHFKATCKQYKIFCNPFNPLKENDTSLSGFKEQFRNGPIT